ncbi:hypothetical protein B0H10DRAFT_1942415 [Mycena sp. CBHHK59/15]|nr:hypothetical protein B0H10DRAFT_1942415 [Mycena sp. CBHHK59/15]
MAWCCVILLSTSSLNVLDHLAPEESLDEIREIVRQRLKLASISDFLLFYDTDIALENDDDFDAFEVYAHSVSNVDVLVKISPQAPKTAADHQEGPAAIIQVPRTVAPDGVVEIGTDPPRKKRKLAAADVDSNTSSISSAPRQKKRKDNTGPITDEAVVSKTTSSVTGPTEPLTSDQERPKKKPKKATKADPNATVPMPSTSKKSKKTKPNKETPADKSRVDEDQFPVGKSLARAISAPGENLQADSEPAVVKPKQRRRSASNADMGSKEKLTKPAKAKKNTNDRLEGGGVRERQCRDEPDQEQASAESALKSANDFLRNLVQKLPSVPVTAAQSDTIIPSITRPGAKNQSGQAAKKVASGSKGSNSTSAAGKSLPCPVCQTSPPHVRYRCPIIVAGLVAIENRIAELQQDETADHSQLIKELRVIAQKREAKAGKFSQGVHTQPSQLHGPLPTQEKVSHKSTQSASPTPRAASNNDDSSSNSGDDSDHQLPVARKMIPLVPVTSYTDAELENIIRGPVQSRLTVDDIFFEEEDERAESVVLENDEEDDIRFRRLSRQIRAPASSDEDEEEEDEVDQGSLAGEATETLPLPSSIRPDSSPSSTRSTIDLTAINARPSVDVDLNGDKAFAEALASDNAIFSSAKSVPAEVNESTPARVDKPSSSAKSARLPLDPACELDLAPKVPHLRSGKIIQDVEREDDPIESADGFPPTPGRDSNLMVPGTPSTPQRIIQRMKDRSGKTPAKLSQLAPPRLPSPVQTKPTESSHGDVDPVAGNALEASSQRSRRITRGASLATMPPPAEVQQPKRRRAPNKTPEQRAEEAAVKLAAKEERERARKEKAINKAAAKKAASPNLGESVTDNAEYNQDTEDLANTVPSPKVVAKTTSSPDEPTTPMPSLTMSSVPMSRDKWTTLPPIATSPTTDDYRDRDSMLDELRSSSPEQLGIREKEASAPLFLPAESQIPFPYSQWNDMLEEACPGSPKDSEDEDSEDEVEASIKASQRPSVGSYRRLTDIASQPSLFSATSNLRPEAFPSATFPRAQNKREELYGTVPQEEDDATDSDSSASDAPSHIPKSRRAGMIIR